MTLAKQAYRNHILLNRDLDIEAETRIFGRLISFYKRKAFPIDQGHTPLTMLRRHLARGNISVVTRKAILMAINSEKGQ